MTVSIASRAAVCAFLFYSSIGFAAAVTDEDSLAEAVAAGGSVKIAAREIKLSRTVSITRDTTIEGRGGRTIISGENAVRVFEVFSNVNLTLIGLTIANGRSTNGGAIYNDGGNVMVIDCRFLNHVAQGNEALAGARGTNGATNIIGWKPGDGAIGSPGTAARGGAIFNRGKLQVWSSLFQNNAAVASEGGLGGAGGSAWNALSPGMGGHAGDGADAEGGAVYSDGAAEFFSTRFIGNGARASAGGIGGSPGTNEMRMYGSRIWGESGASGSARGGAVFTTGTVRSSDSTFDSNYVIGADGRTGHWGGGGGVAWAWGANGRAGQNGGDAFGAAVFAQGQVTVTRSLCRQNTTIAGNGGHGGGGGVASAVGSHGMVPGGHGGSAGTGGVAHGGALAVLGNLTVIGSKFLANTVTAGSGGNGGSGGSALGTAWPPNGADGAPAGTAAGGAIFQAAGHFSITTSRVLSNFVNGSSGGRGGGAGSSHEFLPNPAGRLGQVGVSANVFGGGICALGETSLSRSQVGFNKVIGTLGSNGIAGGGSRKIGTSGTSAASGGSTFGGGGWFGGKVELLECSFVGNQLLGGNGGDGGRGAVGMYTQSWGGAGGWGGHALGAGLYADAETVMVNCTVAHNTAASGNGGIGAPGDSEGYADTWNRPIDGAGPGGHGGNVAAGVSFGTNAVATLSYCTIASNAVLIGVGGAGPTNYLHPEGRWGRAGTNSGTAIQTLNAVTLLASIVAGETGVNCTGNIIDTGFNLSSDSSCGFTSATSLNNLDPRLLPLANNGGPTLTMALASDSPARDAALTDSCPTTDQRGYARPSGNACDIGAFEFNAIPAEEANAFAIVGSVTDGDAGIAGVRVRIGRQIVMTDKSGKYRLNGLRPGNYIVRPVAPEVLFQPSFHRVRLSENTMTPAFVVKTVRARRE